MFTKENRLRTLRRFKRKVTQEDILKEVKKHAFYIKPGEKRRLKQDLARKRMRKKIRRAVVEDRKAGMGV
jgi:small subunit ribosomal protein S21